jgi:hypothetical protein
MEFLTLVVRVVLVRPHQLLALPLPMQVAVVAVDIHPLAQQREQAVLVVAVMARLLVLVRLVLPTLAAVVEAVRVVAAQGEQVVLVLSFFLSQQLDTQAHPLEAQRSQQAAQTLS